MSIKLYNGKKSELNITNFFNEAIKFKKILREEKNNYYRNILGIDFVVDNAENLSKMQKAEEIHALFLKFKMVLFPFRNKTLILDYYSHSLYEQKIIEEFERKLKIKRWGYWDNFDPIPNKKEWREREFDWNNVLLNKKESIPEKSGLIMTLEDEKVNFFEL